MLINKYKILSLCKWYGLVYTHFKPIFRLSPTSYVFNAVAINNPDQTFAIKVVNKAKITVEDQNEIRDKYMKLVNLKVTQVIFNVCLVDKTII